MALYLIVLLLKKLNIRRVNNLHLDMQTTSRTRGESSMSPPRSQIASSTTNTAAAVARQSSASAAAASNTMTDQEKKATNCIQMFTRVLMK